jgi:hypothetical protein
VISLQREAKAYRGVDPSTFAMNILLATILALATMSIAAVAAPSIVLAQNMTEGTPEVSKLPAEQNMTGNATNTTITEGISPNVTG